MILIKSRESDAISPRKKWKRNYYWQTCGFFIWNILEQPTIGLKY